MFYMKSRNPRRKPAVILPYLLLLAIAVLAVLLWLLWRFVIVHNEPLPTANEATPFAPPSVQITAAPTTSPTVAATTPSSSLVPTATKAASPTHSIEDGLWTYTDVDADITIKRYTTQNTNGTITYYAADVFLSDPSRMATFFANDTFGRNQTDYTSAMAERVGAILAINGDYCGFRSDGIIIRNGELLREKPVRECMAIYADGSMKVLAESTMSVQDQLTQGVVQTFSFGPGLVIDGKIPDVYKSDVKKANPRCAIGMIKPGHYIFLMVDGRNPPQSVGMTMDELGATMLSLGCVEAYNLDGGASASMYFMGETINHPSGGGRKISDILYISPLAIQP